MRCENFLQALKLLAIAWLETNSRLNSLLPAAKKEKSLLRREAEITVVRHTVLQDAEIFEEFADVNRFGSRQWNVVRGPRVSGDFNFTPARVAPRSVVHFQQNKIGESTFVEAQSRAEAGDSATHNDDRKLFAFSGQRERSAVAKLVAKLRRLVDERPSDWLVGLERQADEARAGRGQEIAPLNG